jgi:hypothetical protein
MAGNRESPERAFRVPLVHTNIGINFTYYREP